MKYYLKLLIAGCVWGGLLLGCSPPVEMTDLPQVASLETESPSQNDSDEHNPKPQIPTGTPPPTPTIPQQDPAPESTPIDTNVGQSPGTSYDEVGLVEGPGSRFIVLDNPEMVAAAEADWLFDDDLVLGVVYNGEAQAFPIRQMAYHHIANAEIGGKPYLVTY